MSQHNHKDSYDSSKNRGDDSKYQRSNIREGRRDEYSYRRSERESLRENPLSATNHSRGPSQHSDSSSNTNYYKNNTKDYDRKSIKGHVDSPVTKEGSNSEESSTKSIEPLKPNFKLSGALATQARTTESGIVLKYAEPEEARVPVLKWRLFPFKGDEALDPIIIYQKSYYLLGRDREVVDIPLDHPSCSSQHAVIVHRQIQIKDETTGLKRHVIRPFIIDLESRNGTFLNDVKLDDSRYYELLEKDILKFGSSSREYIVLNEKSK